MARVLLQVASPAPAQLQVIWLDLTTVTPAASTSFIFLCGVALIAVIFIILLIFLKWIKPEALSKICNSFKSSSVAPKYLSGNLRTICYFDYRTLKKATKNFHEKNQLGRGGFGPVYQGVLDDGRMIAVKQLSIGKSAQGESEFLSEVRMITSIQHRNLVRLIGCCSEGEQRLLVYEYMQNRSLDSIIYGKDGTFLSWSTRFQIILGIARGLQYLHEDAHMRIIHRDIKASNILLDDKFLPRISDFGLARFFPEDQAYLSTTVAGTLGYTAPEYAIRGELTEKADIYSFGVLTLEIVSCRMNTDLSLSSDVQYLPEYAWKLYEKSKIIDLVDPKLRNEDFVESEVLHVCRIALFCLQHSASVRPPMSEVVALLTCKAEPACALLKPAFVDRKRHCSKDMPPESIPDIAAPSAQDSTSLSHHEKSISLSASPLDRTDSIKSETNTG